MILHKNVCDNCSNEEDIIEKDGKIEIQFSLLTVYDAVFNNKKHPFKAFNGTFCSKNCLVEYFKENLKEDATVRGLKEKP